MRNNPVPLLLSLADMESLGIYYDNLDYFVVHKATEAQQPIIRKFGHPFIDWVEVQQRFYSAPELRQLYRRFGHPICT